MPVDRRQVWMPGGVRTEIHLTGEDTGGAFCLLVDYPPAGWSLPPHRHSAEAETIFIVRGAFEMIVDGRHHRMTAGQSIHVPAGALHEGCSTGSEAGERIVIFSPAGLEEFFLELGGATPDTTVDPSEALAVARRYGWRFEV